MKGDLQIYYDEEGDFLELGIEGRPNYTFKNLGKGIFEKVDKKTGEVTGVAIHEFKKRTKNLKTLTVPSNLPLH